MKRCFGTSCRRRLQQRGSILLIATLGFSVLFGFMGLALDGGFMYYQRRRMQTAADAGALSGAQELLRNSSATYATVQSAALKDTSFNGFSNGGDVTVTVNMPPQSGAKAGVSGFVEVIVSQPQSTTFLRILNINSTNVAARAVAGLTNGLGCVYALDQDPSTSNQYGFTINGNTTVNMNCGVYSNSNFSAVGGGCLSDNNINFVNPTGYTNQCGTPNLQPAGPVTDPLASLYPTAATTIATKSNCDYNVANGYRPTDGVPLQPGVYCGGIKITGRYNSPIVFQPGNYVIVGSVTGSGSVGLNISLSNASVSGTGVTFFLTYPGSDTTQYAPVNISGNGSAKFSAPTGSDDPYRGLLFYQDPTVPGTIAQNATTVMGGGAGTYYQGILYFPTTNLQYSGSSSTTQNGTDGYTILVAYNTSVIGGSVINSNYTAIGGDPLKVAAFAE